MSESYLVIELNQQPVELCKLLKIANLVGGGGEAKIVISEGYVLLNGEVEYQKRKKVYHEDVVEFNGEVVQLIINETLTATKSISQGDVKQVTLDTSEHVQETNNDNSQEKLTQKKSKLSNHTNQTTKKPTNKNKPDSAQQLQHGIEPIMPKKRRPISF
jgi:ribosome-associated protein